MTHDDHRQDSYAQVFHIGNAHVSVDYYADQPKPGPHWIFTIERAGIKRIYKYTLRPNHLLEMQAAKSSKQIAEFLLHHVKSAEPVKTVKRGEEK
jgi:hypothetical protein